MTLRIHARIDEALARKLPELRRWTGKSTTEVLVAALERYCAVVGPTSDAATLLAGFVGCANGPRALSTNYKAELRWKNRKPFKNLLVVD
jgi:hypothetical protein